MKCAKVLERMINQNNHDEIAQGDCRLLVCVISIRVLLQISSSMTTELMNSEKMKAHSFLCGNSHSWRPRSWITRRCAGTRPTVISLLPVSVHVRLEWREEYFIGISFLDEMRNQAQNGVICICSLKNPSYPEYLCWAESGVMCLDFHQQVRGEGVVLTVLTVLHSTRICSWWDSTTGMLPSTTYRPTLPSRCTDPAPVTASTKTSCGR